MQCEIRGMREMAEAARTTDTLPKPGRVNEVCREWLVKEDGALAYRLQSEEIQQHYIGNKSRNARVREDFPQALQEQQKEQDEAVALQQMYTQILREQEEIDAQVASQIAQNLEEEERTKQLELEEIDKKIAQRLQEREKLKAEKLLRQQDQEQYGAHSVTTYQQSDCSPSNYNRDMNSVGLPLPSEYNLPVQRPVQLCQQMRMCAINDNRISPHDVDHITEDLEGVTEHSSPLSKGEEEARRIQEEKDAEYARMLQEQEGRGELSLLDQDRLLAIEAQDKELARLLQERERAKAKRARERARQRALLKKQQPHPERVSDDEGFAISPGALPSPYSVENWPEHTDQTPQLVTSSGAPARPTDLDLSNTRGQSRLKPKYVDPEAIEVLHSSSPEPGPSRMLPNIAMAIDPTYPRRVASHSVDSPVSNMSSPGISLPPPGILSLMPQTHCNTTKRLSSDFEGDDGPVPPYMPIQGQRRSASLEKKSKKGKSKKEGKDSCKQQ